MRSRCSANATGRGETKRSAVVALAGILEERRSLLADELLTKDEGALFQIANKFGIRHQRADQRDDLRRRVSRLDLLLVSRDGAVDGPVHRQPRRWEPSLKSFWGPASNAESS